MGDRGTEVPFGPGITSGLIAIVIGIIPDQAPLALVPAVLSLIGSIRTLGSPRAPQKTRGRIGLALGCAGLFLAFIAIADWGHQATMWEYEPPVDTCDVSPFCTSYF